MTTIFLLIIEDRHADVEVRAFVTPEAAIAAARETQEWYADDGNEEAEEAEEVTERMKAGGWLYHATLTCEGDALRVQSVELETDQPKENV